MAREAFDSIKKACLLGKGRMFWIAFIGAFILTLFLYSCSEHNASLKDGLYQELYGDSKLQDIVIPVILQLIGVGLYAIFNLLDLLTGMQAAKYENSLKEVPEKNWIKSSKLYKTLWKVLGVCFLTFMFMLITLVLEALMPESWYYWIGIWAMIIFWLIAIGAEFHSLGENIERRSGSKPAIFGFWDTILQAFEKKAVDKIDSL